MSLGGAVDHWPLDTPLLYLSPDRADALRIRDFLEGIQIFWQLGSGKTSGSGNALSEALLRAGFGGLILCASPEERAIWEARCRRTNRSGDLIVFSPSEEWRFNFLQQEIRRHPDSGFVVHNVVELLANVVEVTDGYRREGGDQGF